jgi:hypothetical protein
VATLQDIYSYFRKTKFVKRERRLTIERRSSFVNRLLRRTRREFPYARGPLGGYLVPFVVRDRRGGICREHWIKIEMAPPTKARPHWLVLELEISFFQMCGLTHTAVSTGYRSFRKFVSIRYRGNRVYFDRDAFYEHDWGALDRTLPYDEDRPLEEEYVPNARRGRHRADCRDRTHRGKCAVPPRAKKPRQPSGRRKRHGRRWTTNSRTRTPRPPRTSPRHKLQVTADVPDWDEQRPSEQEAYFICLPKRPTATEMRLWRLAGEDPAKYTDLVIEYSDEVAADRAAGRFEARKPKKK